MSAPKTTVKKTEASAKKKQESTAPVNGTSQVLALKPRMSEKTYAQSHELNTYAFDVPGQTNKIEVAKAVTQQFKVTVEDVRILILKGKKARSIRIGGTRKNVTGRRVDIKKAYVRLKQGDSIPIFASIDEAEEKAKKAEAKAAKKTASSTKISSVSKPSKKSPKAAEAPVNEKKEELLKPKSRFSFRRRSK